MSGNQPCRQTLQCCPSRDRHRPLVRSAQRPDLSPAILRNLAKRQMEGRRFRMRFPHESPRSRFGSRPLPKAPGLLPILREIAALRRLCVNRRSFVLSCGRWNENARGQHSAALPIGVRFRTIAWLQVAQRDRRGRIGCSRSHPGSYH
jgi:hypothetical protein